MNRKTILSAVGIIALGALGSGLWELIKPLLGWTWSGILTVATLGLATLREGIYIDAANNFGRPIIGAITQSLAGLICLIGAGIIRIILESFRPQSTVLRVQPFIFLVFAVLLMIISMRTRYVEQLNVYYTKLVTIAAPFISDGEMETLHSEYVRTKGREQYLQQVEKLRRLIRENGIQPPMRDFF